MQPRLKERILIVEDAAFLRATLREIVERAGYEVVGEACDGSEAVDRYRELAPDIVLMDLVMPGLSAIEAVREIRRLNPVACIIACSMLGQEKLIRKALRAGVRETILKPYQPEAVRAALRRALDGKALPQSQRETRDSRTLPGSTPRPSKPSRRPPAVTSSR